VWCDWIGRHQRTETSAETQEPPGGPDKRGDVIQGRARHQSQHGQSERRKRNGKPEGMSIISICN